MLILHDEADIDLLRLMCSRFDWILVRDIADKVTLGQIFLERRWYDLWVHSDCRQNITAAWAAAC